ncbi:MAG TPA: type IX secretion system sortase PorU [Tenuifilaceae bacterium]|nr:type IX secretion system sortase PorU [Tenuifilaceae bacterium]HPN22272.1 type IX secretion system sortase PorU [Tenuifilaceae bacterium]
MERTIDWSTKDIDNDVFLWFERAVYPDPVTMVPSYYELIGLDDLNISGIDALTINNQKWESLNELEKTKIKNFDSFTNSTLNHSTSTERGKNFLQITIPSIRLNNGVFEKLVSFSISINEKSGFEKIINNKSAPKTASVLSSGKWIKVSVENSGIHKITHSELQTFGLTNLSNISVWGNGGKRLTYMNNEPSADDLNPIPIYIEKGTDGVFNQGDYILFYAEGPKTLSYNSAMSMWSLEQHPYTSKIYYFITTSQPQLLIENASTPPESVTNNVNTYDAIVTFEQNDTNLVKSGREWFGESFDITTTRRYITNMSNPEAGSTLKVWVRAAARSSSSSNFQVKANSQVLGYLNLGSVIIGDELADVASVNSQVYTTTIPTNSLSIELTYNKPNSASTAWLDFITINAKQTLSYSGNQLMFRDIQSVGSGKVSQFTIQNVNSNTKVWDVTNINATKQVQTLLTGNELTFKQETGTLKQFIAYEPSNTLSVTFVNEVPNQNLHGLNQPDMVIVTHPLFLTHSNEIATLHQENDGLNVAVVTNEQVFNEFSSGNPDVSAIRNLMRMLYKRASGENEMPKYLLLFGDGSYNNLSTSKSNTNLVLTYQSDRSINKTNSFVTDDFFGLLDDDEGGADGLLDIGIGRLPVKNIEEANVVVNKIKNYMSGSNNGIWQSQLCFIGDDEDGNVHMQDANTLAEYIETNHKEYNVQKIFFDAYKQTTSSGGASYPDVTKAVNTTVNNGSLLVNYTGHGNERWLSHEKAIMLDDVLSWQNINALSLFVTATCEFSRFDDYHMTSTGEWILLSPKGGGVALLSTTRLVYSSPNFVLNYNFVKNIFKRNADGSYNTLGDLVRITKNLSGTGYNKRNFSLLGDPALKLQYPKKQLELLTVNNVPITNPIDTLKALSEINLTGQVSHFNGTPDASFNGTATITVFDKAKQVTTLANDGGSTMTFSSVDNIIYKGKATVENGNFAINFTIPKDINYQYGSGRISFYAEDEVETAMGYNEAITVGGINPNPTIDNYGPLISIFLNDENFVNGGISDPNPRFLIKLSDENGINTTGIGIGHDIIATLTPLNQQEQKFNLNNHYQSVINDFKSGIIDFQISNLSQGLHRLKVKAWDIYNNSSESEIAFNVTSGNQLKIEKFYNYPNPITDNTSFYFEHNKPDANLDIEIQIFNFSGMLVERLHYSENNPGNYRIGPIPWSGNTYNGGRLGKGIYICNLIVKSSDGDSANKQLKIVIAR